MNIVPGWSATNVLTRSVMKNEYYIFFIKQRFGGRSQESAELAFIVHQRNDQLKEQYCDENGFLLLRIPYTEFDSVRTTVIAYIADNIIRNN
jgi:hypothetical protein